MNATHISWLGSVAVAWVATAAVITTSACGGSERHDEDVARRGSPVIILPVPDPCIVDPSLCTGTTSSTAAANDPEDSNADDGDGDTSTDDGDTSTDDGDTGADDGGDDSGDSGDDSGGDSGDDSGDYGDDSGDDGGGDDF